MTRSGRGPARRRRRRRTQGGKILTGQGERRSGGGGQVRVRVARVGAEPTAGDDPADQEAGGGGGPVGEAEYGECLRGVPGGVGVAEARSGPWLVPTVRLLRRSQERLGRTQRRVVPAERVHRQDGQRRGREVRVTGVGGAAPYTGEGTGRALLLGQSGDGRGRRGDAGPLEREQGGRVGQGIARSAEVTGGGAAGVDVGRGAHPIGERGDQIPVAERARVTAGDGQQEREVGDVGDVGCGGGTVRGDRGIDVRPQVIDDLGDGLVLPTGPGQGGGDGDGPVVVDETVVDVVAVGELRDKVTRNRLDLGFRRWHRHGRPGRGRGWRRGRRRAARAYRCGGEARRPGGAADVGAAEDPRFDLTWAGPLGHRAEWTVGPVVLPGRSDPVGPVGGGRRRQLTRLVGRRRVLGTGVEGG